MNTEEMIMNDVATTEMDINSVPVETPNIAPSVVAPQQINPQQLGFRKTRTIIRENSVKVGRNDLCPCGSGKKYKKCCGRDTNKYNSIRELSSQEMAKIRNFDAHITSFKK